jgi:prophage DNA circulation protein
MSWRDQLRRASFRGVPFEVESVQNRGGRRADITEFPLRNDPQTDDLGRRARSMRFQAFVIGTEYMAVRDALMEALEADGPGTLVHPYLGEMDVQIGDVSFSESSREGGMATFDIECWMATGAVYPRVQPDTQAQTAAAVDAASQEAAEAFAEDFGVDGQPEFVVDAAIARVREVAAQVKGAVATVTTLPAEISVLTDAVDQLSAAASSLVLAPTVLVDRVGDLLRQMVVAAERPRGALDALQALFGFGSDLDAVPATTPTRQREADNQAALVQVVQQLATLEAARAASQTDFPSLDDAQAVREILTDQFDLLCEQDISDQVYRALVATRAATARDIGTRGADLARLRKIQLPETMPSLVLAWSLYGDASRADELAERNRLADPLFVPSGVPLEALDA